MDGEWWWVDGGAWMVVGGWWSVERKENAQVPPFTLHDLPSTIYPPRPTLHDLPSTIHPPRSTLFQLLVAFDIFARLTQSSPVDAFASISLNRCIQSLVLKKRLIFFQGAQCRVDTFGLQT